MNDVNKDKHEDIKFHLSYYHILVYMKLLHLFYPSSYFLSHPFFVFLHENKFAEEKGM